MIATRHVVKQEHRLGQLLDGSLEIDPIEQPAQPQSITRDFVSRQLIIGFHGTFQRVRRLLVLAKTHKSYVGSQPVEPRRKTDSPQNV
jgi:hypothetical protein